ncbi:MAG: hypothetical protein C0483_25120 [Pirellula sp.]|nr:hypothetical protein [Pirellula sp.]
MAEGSTIGGGGIGPFSFFGATFGATGASIPQVGAAAQAGSAQAGAAQAGAAQAGAAQVGAAQVGAALPQAGSAQAGAEQAGAAQAGAAFPQAGSAQAVQPLPALPQVASQQLLLQQELRHLNRLPSRPPQPFLQHELPQGSQQPLPAPHEGPAAPQAGSAQAEQPLPALPQVASQQAALSQPLSQQLFLQQPPRRRSRMPRRLQHELPQGSQQPLPAPHEGPAEPQAGSQAA